MKLYEVVTIDIKKNGEYGDEHQTYLGFDLDEALKAKKTATDDFDRMTSHDKEMSTVECRVYDIEDVDPNDIDAVLDAKINCIGYNEF